MQYRVNPGGEGLCRCGTHSNCHRVRPPYPVITHYHSVLGYLFLLGAVMGYHSCLFLRLNDVCMCSLVLGDNDTDVLDVHVDAIMMSVFVAGPVTRVFIAGHSRLDRASAAQSRNPQSNRRRCPQLLRQRHASITHQPHPTTHPIHQKQKQKQKHAFFSRPRPERLWLLHVRRLRRGRAGRPVCAGVLLRVQRRERARYEFQSVCCVVLCCSVLCCVPG